MSHHPYTEDQLPSRPRSRHLAALGVSFGQGAVA